MYAHTYVAEQVCGCGCVGVRARVCACVRARVCACVRARVCACVRARVCACVHWCMCAVGTNSSVCVLDNCTSILFAHSP